MKNSILLSLLLATLSMSAAARAAGDATAGEAVYNKACKMCHVSGMMGAPKTDDKAAWAPRLAQGEAVLVQHAIEGFGKMPPKGNCKTCSDDDVANAVAYLLNQAQQP